MTKTLLDGPGRVLESVHPRFLVDLAQGDDARLPQAHQQQFRERLMQELLARVQLQTWTNGGMLNAPLSLRLTLVEKLASMLDPGHLALTQIADTLLWISVALSMVALIWYAVDLMKKLGIKADSTK